VERFGDTQTLRILHIILTYPICVRVCTHAYIHVYICLYVYFVSVSPICFLSLMYLSPRPHFAIIAQANTLKGKSKF